MTFSLPADPPRARSLTRVVPEMSAALAGGSDWFAPARSAIVWVLDGLGVFNLSSRAGHARFLSEARAKRDAARTVFPSTTASALTSLLTGTLPGEHGIVGYRARVPGTDDVVNQLRGWDTDGLPLSFQRALPLSATLGRPLFAVSRREYADTGFTAATLGDAEFHVLTFRREFPLRRRGDAVFDEGIGKRLSGEKLSPVYPAAVGWWGR